MKDYLTHACRFCTHYSSEFMPEENYSENYCDVYHMSCFSPCTKNCPNFFPKSHLTNRPDLHMYLIEIKFKLLQQNRKEN